MMSIEDEVQHVLTFLIHPAGFEISLFGTLCIRPIDEYCPPTNWAVDWEEVEDGIVIEYEREFASLKEAVQFFVEKRRYMCHGIDFEKELNGAIDVIVEIE
jgi:hypothetical protein